MTASEDSLSVPPASLRERVRTLVEAKAFEQFIVVVIVLNAIGLGLETSPAIMAQAGGVIDQLDGLALTIFVIELALKLFAYGWRFFKNGWNIFDLAIVSAALMPAGDQFSVLRALRILRALRLVSVVPSMRKVIVGLFRAIPSIGTVIVMLLLLFYISAVMATKLFGPAFPEWFGHLGASLYSLFQIMTLESWSMGIVRPVMEVYPSAWAFFVPFIMVTAFAVLNLFIGIIVSGMQQDVEQEAAASRDAMMEEQTSMHDDIKALRQDVRALKDAMTELSASRD